MFSFRYPCVVLLAGTVAGTLLGHVCNPGVPFLTVGVLAAALLLVLAFFRLPRRYFIIPLGSLTLFWACLNSVLTYRVFPADDVGRLAGDPATIRFFARIDTWPVLKRHRTFLTCRVDSLVYRDSVVAASGLILVTVERETTHFALNDRISFSGRLRQPMSGGYPGGFDYSRYLFNKGIRGQVTVDNPVQILVFEHQRNIIGRTLNDIRRWILACLRANMTAIPSALASGFLIGETRDIPDEVYQAFRRTGTMHLLAVSGSNVALVLVVFFYLLRQFRVRRVPRTAILLVIIVAFCHLSYNQPSVVRASIMAALILVARAIYRRIELNNIIAAAATILILYDPANLFDIGFQLSFAVTWGLILFLPSLNHLMQRWRPSRPVHYLLLIAGSSFIATLISAPITTYYFGETSLVTVFSNLVVVPLVAMAVIGIVVLLMVNLILPVAAVIPGLMLDRLLVVIHALVLWFGQWKFSAVSTASFPASFAILSLVGVAASFLALRRRIMRYLAAAIVALLAVSYTAMHLFGGEPKRGSIEIFNQGSSTAVIMNQGGGIVIYRERVGGHDEFCLDLIPYLKRRGRPFPSLFAFVEPAYVTERHLDLVSRQHAGIVFHPVTAFPGGNNPSLWTTRQGGGDFASDSSIIVRVAPGAVTVQAEDFGRVAFLERPEYLDAVDPDSLDHPRYIFVGIDDDADLARLSGVPRNSIWVLVLQRYGDAYSQLLGTLADSGIADSSVFILEKYSHLYLPLEDCGPARHPILLPI